MRYRSKKKKEISWLKTILLCLVLILTELYALDVETEFQSLHTVAINNLSTVFWHNKRVDKIAEISRSLSDEVTSDISSGAVNLLSPKINSFDFLSFLVKNKGIYPFTLKVLLTLLLNAYVIRRYLILYIHNSDGEKGVAAGYRALIPYYKF
ncbi:hypothetical protein Ana3638_08860 [Anaerocolumna sedimenticola]|uniref:Uncharacterized protein n=1 Tax=Anaerocolumna sedimenticola TaxID=2696063 RepID=A0A6P1TKA5_9FIRM|nr:hypothetical protein [Anaerocolumna sedimenticola]QHQ60863.1 hypothetical protein Ana3638_08860 [Anaerocolumna sedimenticola]